VDDFLCKSIRVLKFCCIAKEKLKLVGGGAWGKKSRVGLFSSPSLKGKS